MNDFIPQTWFVGPASNDDQQTRVLGARESESLLGTLLSASVVLWEDFAALPEERRDRITHASDPESMLRQLVEAGLLTTFQRDRIRDCPTAEIATRLMLANYRILDMLGAGGMGMVFKAEHVLMRRQVALKVLHSRHEADPRLLSRFLSEMRAVAFLRHPNIVAAFDAGKIHDPECGDLVSYYLVMEYAQGKNLEEVVRAEGPLPVALACELVYQLAGALVEVNDSRLVHRDIKPSNVLVTPDRQAKLLDFGLARNFCQVRDTEQGTILGTLGYVAPEQIKDSSTVDIRADIYGLGGVLYWALTGETPFRAEMGSVAELFRRLQEDCVPPPIRHYRPELPATLEAVVACMLAPRPEDRYPTPGAVMRALLPFLAETGLTSFLDGPAQTAPLAQGGLAVNLLATRAGAEAILVADDDPINRLLCVSSLQQEGFTCVGVSDGREAIDAFTDQKFDLVVLDIDMPELSGPEVLLRLRQAPPCPNLKVIMLSGMVSGDDMSRMLQAGADDYLVKPVSLVQLVARVESLIQLKKAQDRAIVLTGQLFAINAELERDVRTRTGDVVQIRNTLGLALAQLIEQKTSGSASRLLRMQRYCRCLAEAARELPGLSGVIDEAFIDMLESCVPLYDLGMVAMPDEVLRKPGRLGDDENLIAQSHTVIGAEAFRKLTRGNIGGSVAFLQMAHDLARHHHERWDGNGYPDRLAGNDIPLGARILSLADVYDALRSPRPHRPSLSHHAAVMLMTERSPGHFDPVLVQAFREVAATFHQIYRELPDTRDEY